MIYDHVICLNIFLCVCNERDYHSPSVKYCMVAAVKTMAHIRLDPPEPFNSAKPGEWSRWKRRFDQFRVASGLDEEGDGRQVCTLLYCLEEQAEDVLTSACRIWSEDRKEYQKVVATLDKFSVCAEMLSSSAQVQSPLTTRGRVGGRIYHGTVQSSRGL